MTDLVPEEPVPLKVLCPRCRKRTDRIQVYDVPLVVCIVYIVWSRQRVAGCPDCVRQSLVLRLLASIVLTNLLCLIFVPMHLGYLIHSFATSRPGVPPEYAYLIDAVPDVTRPVWKGVGPGRGRRMAVALVILAVVLGGVFLVPILLKAVRAIR
jgi:hypothetical protein